LSFEGGISGHPETAILWIFPAVLLKLSYRSGNSAWVILLSYERMLRSGRHADTFSRIRSMDQIRPGRRYCRRSCIVLVLAVIFGCAASLSAQAPKPNVVVIMTDDLGYNEVGFTGELTGRSTQYETPTLDALAQRSVVARQGYAAAPICSPSRAGLLTGRYHQVVGFEYNIDPNGAVPAPANDPGLTADDTTIAQHLKGLGYSTGMIGKWHTGYVEGVNLPTDMGFDEFYGFWGGGRDYFSDFHPARIIRKGTQNYESQYRIEGNPAEYDPNNGRYVTDAFGDESADYIRRHAGEDQPFFLYTALTAPHDPGQAKRQDIDHFPNITDLGHRTKAGMVYAMDRSIGKILNAIDDPNGDGHSSDSIRDNTIVVFLNDNGGDQWADNGPFRGRKGLTWEGGIRVPFIISAPGLDVGVYDAPISAYDILATAYTAAGGDLSQIQTDGVDLMPYLTGAETGRPHETLFWRTNDIWAARKGDWKIGDYEGSSSPMRLYNVVDDPGETNDLAAQHPEIVADLLRELTFWEATLEKPLWGITVGNAADHFVYQANTFFSFWSFPNNWKDAATGNSLTMSRADAYANMILEFRTKDDGNYFASNNMTRLTKQTFMLNELRLAGNFAGPAAHDAGIEGNGVLLVKNLDGVGPKIRLDATSSGTSARFQFNLQNDLQILDDLEITGDGTQEFAMYGGIHDYFHPRNVTKTGASHVTLAGNSTFHGSFSVLGGQVKVNGAGAGITGASSIVVGNSGSLVMDSGLISVPSINHSAGGSFQFTGGELRVTSFIGDLTNEGGNYSPGASPAISTVSEDFVQTSGTLTIELAGPTPGSGFDQLNIGGTATLGGTLQLNLLDGYSPAPGTSFEFLRSIGGVTGAFANTIFPNAPGLLWQLDYEPLAVRLSVDAVPNPLALTNPLPGDYNFNGAVDAADYVVWIRAVGTNNFAADGDGDGVVDNDDYVVWQANFGKTASLPARSSALGNIPEPGTLALCLLMVLPLVTGSRRRSVR
jgi:autotransporter-associated beta strand protein